MVKVKHRPRSNVKDFIKVYEEEYGTPIEYVCTTSMNPGGEVYDIFYSETTGYLPVICYETREWDTYVGDTDKIEDFVFECIEGSEGWEYSTHVHDYKVISDKGYAEDLEVKQFYVKDGKFCPE